MNKEHLSNLPQESAEELYENAPCGFVSFLTDGTIFKINTTLLNLLGYEKEEIVKRKKLIDLFRIAGKIYFETHFFPLVKMQGFVREINFDLVRKDGTFFPALINVEQVTNREKTISTYRASIVNITDRKKYEKVLLEGKEKAEKVTKAKAEFLSTISHEIRTPLNAIVGIGNLLQQTSLDEVQLEYAKILRASSGNLLELVNNLLDLSKLEAQKVKIEERNFDLKELLERVINTYKLRATEKNIELKKVVPENLPDYLKGDPIKLNQVLNNLIGNAIKFTKSGEIIVKVSIREQERENIYLTISISDTGIGIPTNKLEEIFQEFSQASYDINLEFGGTGLGLTISQKLLQMHNSRLKVKSEEGKGSEFSFDIKYKKSKHAAKQDDKKEVKIFLEKTAATILVVDDNPTNLFIISQYLQNWGVNFSTVNSGLAAIEAVQKQTYNLVLMDLHMPTMNGYEASARITELDLETKPVIIALSASGRGDVNVKMKRSGISAYIPKPFDPSELQEVMVQFLQKGGEKLEERKSDNHEKILPKNFLGESQLTSFSLSQYIQLANGDPTILRKLVQSGIDGLKKFRNEFSTAANNSDFEKINELIHKNTMTLHYLKCDLLKKLIIDLRDSLKTDVKQSKIVKRQKNLVMNEFNSLIIGLESFISRDDTELF